MSHRGLRSASSDPAAASGTSARRTRSAQQNLNASFLLNSTQQQPQPQQQTGPASAAAAAGGGAVSWHRGANSRCLACLRLDANCICSTNENKENPALAPSDRKAALEQLASSTPFARAKQQKAVDALAREVNDTRSHIIRSRQIFVDALQEQLQCGLALLLEEEDESAHRDSVARAAAAARRRIHDRFVHDFNTASLRGEERTMRRTVSERWHIDFERIKDLAEFEFEIASIVTFETMYRQEFSRAEGTSRCAQLDETASTLLRMADQFTRECESIQYVYFNTREEIVRECSSHYRELMKAHATRSARVVDNLRQRSALLDAVHAGVRALEVQERALRQRLRRRFQHNTAELEALLRVFSDERDKLGRDEAFSRSIVRSDETTRFQAMVDYEAQHFEKQTHIVAEKAAARDALLEDALADLRIIQQVEEDTRDGILQQREHDGEEVRQHVMDCAVARQRCLDEALRSLRGVADAECNERSFIEQRIADDEIAMQQRWERDAAERGCLEESELEFRRRLDSQFDSAMQVMQLAMAECAAAVQRVVGSRAAQRSDVGAHEAQLRLELAALEDNARRFIEEERERILSEHLDMLDAQEQERARLEHEACSDLESVYAQWSAIVYEEIDISFTAELEQVLLEQFDREHNELFDAERRFRSRGTLLEFEERRRIVALLASVLRECARAAEDAAREDLALLELAEGDGRDLLRAEAHEEAAELIAWSHRAARAARDLEQRRLAEELNVRELDMLEDPPHPELGMRLSSAAMVAARGGTGSVVTSPDPRFMMYHNQQQQQQQQQQNDYNTSNSHQREHQQYHHHQQQQQNQFDDHDQQQQQQQQYRGRSRTSCGPASLADEHGLVIGNTENCGRVSFGDIRRSVSVAPTNGERQLKVDYLNTVLGRSCGADQATDAQLNFAVALLEKSAERRAEAQRRKDESEKRLREREKQLLRAEALDESRREAVAFHRQKRAEERRRFEHTLATEREQVQRAKKQAKIEEVRAKEMEQLLEKKKCENDDLRDAIRNKLTCRKY